MPPRVKPAVEIIKFMEMRDFALQSRLIHPGATIQVQGTRDHKISVLAMQADHVSSLVG